MTQYTRENPITAPQSGADFAADVNQIIDAMLSNHQGATRPPDLAAGGLWSRITAGVVEVLLFDGTNDVVIYPEPPLLSQDLAGVDAVFFDQMDPTRFSGYNIYMFNMMLAARLRVSTDGVNEDVGASDYSFLREGRNPGSSSGTDDIALTSGLDNASQWSGRIFVPQPDGISECYMRAEVQGVRTGSVARTDVMFKRNSITAFQAIRIRSLGGNFTSGRIVVHPVRI